MIKSKSNRISRGHLSLFCLYIFHFHFQPRLLIISLLLHWISHLDLGIDEDEGTTALLDNSAAKHKMAVRPQRKRRSESRQRDGNQGEEAGIESSQQSDVQVEGSVKKIKSSTDEEAETSKQRGYRRTRSGRQLVTFDPVAKREYMTSN
jgi:preprotein translocase subunit SecF